MSLLKGRLESRAITADDVPWNVGAINGSSDYKSLQLAAVWACTRLICDQTASSPLHLFTKNDQGPKQLASSELLEDPSASLSPYDWKYQGIASAVLEGNGYAPATSMTRSGYIAKAEWVHPNDVIVLTKGPRVLGYEINGEKIEPAEMIHVRGMVMPGQAVGLSPLKASAKAIKMGLEAENFGLNWFLDGAHPTGILSTDKAVNKDQAEAIKSRWTSIFGSKRGVAVLGNGFDYKPVQATAETSQFLPTMRFIFSQVASVFGVPPEMIGGETAGSMTYSNTEARGQDFVTYTLRPWLTRFETTISRLHPDGQYVKFNTGALLRADTKSRYEAYKIGIDAGFLTVEDVRAWEDLATSSSTVDVEKISRILQKIYVAVDKVISTDEARQMVRALGVDLDEGFDFNSGTSAGSLDSKVAELVQSSLDKED